MVDDGINSLPVLCSLSFNHPSHDPASHGTVETTSRIVGFFDERGISSNPLFFLLFLCPVLPFFVVSMTRQPVPMELCQ